jgi:hypothetical protein
MPRRISLTCAALIHQWPAFSLSTSTTAITKIREAAFQTSVSSPHTVFAVIYAGACYQSYFSTETLSDNLQQLQSKQEALKHLRQAVRDADGTATDEILMTIALLAIHGYVLPPKRPRATAPFYRDNEFYSNVKSDPTHLDALRTLVIQRGVLEKLQLYGLSNIISMIDTFQSFITLSRPRFRSLYSTQALVEKLQAGWDDIVRARFADQEDGFEFLEAYSHGSPLRRLISHIRILLQTYHVTLRNPPQAPDFMLFIHTRRSLQHDALCLERDTDCLLEVIRIASIMFVAGWTLPFIKEFQESATHLLLQALNECIVQKRWQAHPDVLLWGTVIGGLSAQETPRVEEFTALLRNSGNLVSKETWPHVKSMSLKFLPFEYELANLGQTFWEQSSEILRGDVGDE